MEEILVRRADLATKRAALPPELPQWKHVDVAAPVWGFLAKPPADNSPATRDVITFEYHTGDDARFILRAPSQLLPDDPATLDPYAKIQPPTAALFVYGLGRMEVDYKLDRPAGEPARVTVPFTGDRTTVARRGLAMTFLTGALFQHCFDPALYGN